jgi:hypothetical protein
MDNYTLQIVKIPNSFTAVDMADNVIKNGSKKLIVAKTCNRILDILKIDGVLAAQDMKKMVSNKLAEIMGTETGREAVYELVRIGLKKLIIPPASTTEFYGDENDSDIYVNVNAENITSYVPIHKKPSNLHGKAFNERHAQSKKKEQSVELKPIENMIIKQVFGGKRSPKMHLTVYEDMLVGKHLMWVPYKDITTMNKIEKIAKEQLSKYGVKLGKGAKSFDNYMWPLIIKSK